MALLQEKLIGELVYRLIAVDPYVLVRSVQGPGEGKRINQTVSEVMGYAVSREFYSPDYTKPGNSPKPVDYRATLYWNPSLQTDAKGRANVVFYNTDSVTTIQVVAEGINDRGQPGYGRMTYAVQAK